MSPEDLLTWFRNEVLQDIVKKGHFSEKSERLELLSCEFERVQIGVDNFASIPCFAKVNLKSTSGVASREILIKFQNQDPVFREKMRTVPQFQNEVTMYNVVLPSFFRFLRTCMGNHEMLEDVVPKCYFAAIDVLDPEKSFIVLQDMRQSGYTVAKAKVDLDLDHCLAALEQLSRFHAVSYAMKYEKSEEWEKLKSSCVDVWFADDETSLELYRDFKLPCSQRALDYLISKTDSEVPTDYLERFRKRLHQVTELLNDVKFPAEPLSVICHGDFNRNNILFRYDVDGKVNHARLFDFQTFLYASPCVDLAFFIYMNTTLAFREKHFEEMFRHYYLNLIKATSDILRVQDEAISTWLPIELFEKDFARVAVHAYVTVSFFLPLMMCPESDFETDFRNQTNKQMAEINCKQGGEVVSQRIAEVIVDFYRRKFYV